MSLIAGSEPGDYGGALLLVERGAVRLGNWTRLLDRAPRRASVADSDQVISLVAVGVQGDALTCALYDLGSRHGLPWIKVELRDRQLVMDPGVLPPGEYVLVVDPGIPGARLVLHYFWLD